GRPSTLVDNEHYYTPRPPASANLVLIAEYREWPFQGVFKGTKIGNKTTYNLEFQLSQALKHFYLLIFSEALGIRSNKETFVKTTIAYDSSVYFKMHSATV
ncbi:hypothetical protein DL98DRAFT_431572, partial [Cadophora sp. DSE1049]